MDIFECSDCRHCRYNGDSNEWYCRRVYISIDPESICCDDFELDD